MFANLFFWTRIYLLNFSFMWKLPAAAFVTLLALRLLMGGKQPCKGLLFIMPPCMWCWASLTPGSPSPTISRWSA